jgi:hypothetical protein
VTLGASTASPANVILTDALTTINTSISVPAVGANITVAGQISAGTDVVAGNNFVLTNGQAQGDSVTGNFQVSAPPIVVPNTGVAQAIPNPAFPGLYAFTVTYTTAGNDAIALSGVGFWSGAVWRGGSAVSPAGPGSAEISPAAGAVNLQIAQSGGGPVTANVVFYKLMNAV